MSETIPWWLAEASPEPLRRRLLERVPDVEVIGGGVTGCACALALAAGGLRVRLYEGRTIAGGASGRNGGFALGGGAMRYDVARETLGGDAARAYWRLTEEYLDRLELLTCLAQLRLEVCLTGLRLRLELRQLVLRLGDGLLEGGRIAMAGGQQNR